MSDQLDTLLTEQRRFPPPQSFAARANGIPALQQAAEQDREGFWAEQARALQWIRPWDQVLEWTPPHAKWFLGGQLNVSANCVDRHLDGPTRNKAALIWEGEPGDRRVLTYWDLAREVRKAANTLKRLGVTKGDRVAIYMPLVPEAVIAMLACTRIGAVHSVIFGGFSAEAVRDRVNDAQAKVLITADGGYRRGQVLPLKRLADEAMEETPSINHCLVVRRLRGTGADESFTDMLEGRDHWWQSMVEAESSECDATPMDAEDLLFILYTSGTTGKPKGIVHTTGGYLTQVVATTKYVFDLKPEDVFWCTADIGWVTGHSYVVYGPLANAATVFIYEGAPDWPKPDRVWSLIARYGVTVLYTAPTAIRSFMKCGTEHPARHNLSSLRLLGSVGEPINPEAWIWYHTHIGGGRCPIVDTWWQTETGGHLISPLPGVTPTKPGSCTFPLPGIMTDIVDETGQSVGRGKGGILVIKRPWPSMIRTIWGDPERFKKSYYPDDFKGKYYLAGDGASTDQDGYYRIMGRIDDVLNVSGHRLGTMEIESALVANTKLVAEAAVVGRPDELTGEAVCAFVVLKGPRPNGEEAKKIAQELRNWVAKEIGPIARPKDIRFGDNLPKTRSGKIMRRLLRAIAKGEEIKQDVSTLENPAILEQLKQVS
jgi:acetyl-CoA synthetase